MPSATAVPAALREGQHASLLCCASLAAAHPAWRPFRRPRCAGRSKGWGIVEFETPEEALTAINTLNGVELGGRTILVREDREDRDVKQVGRAPLPKKVLCVRPGMK